MQKGKKMLIRSQDKRVITNDLNLYIEEYEDKYVIANRYFRLGFYPTELQAIMALEIFCEECHNKIYESIIWDMP